MTMFVQFREEPQPGDGFGEHAFADAVGRPFELLVDGVIYGVAVVDEVAVVEDGQAAIITFRTDLELPRGELGARQVA